MLPRTLDPASLFPPARIEQWRALVDADLHGAPFDKRLVTHTYEGISLQPLYTRADLSRDDPSGFSGMMPMTRGGRPLGNAENAWDLRQECTEPDPASANAIIRDELEGGATSILLRFDACARSALDPRNTGAALTALDGVAIHTLDDLDHVLDGVHLNMISVALEAGSAFIPAAALVAALWERRGVKAQACRAAFNADPIAGLARDGHLPCALPAAIHNAASLAAWTSARYPNSTSIRVGTAPYHHAGATATQDLAFSMATALEYLRAMTHAQIPIDDAARQLSFSYAIGCNIFLAIAKLRAARRLWARIAEACGASEPARRMAMHVRPSKRVLATRDPWINILRNTSCIFAAGVAGADAITSTPHDAPLGEPTELGRRLARNTSHLLVEECSLHRICDPAGGAYYIERLTDELCDKAWGIFQTIEGQGGMFTALQSGWVRTQIDSAFQPRARNIATRKDAIVGVSEFPDPNPLPKPRNIDRDRIARETASRLAAHIAARTPLPEAPASLTNAAPANVDHALDLARAGASIAEINARLWRGSDPPAHLELPIHVHPYAEPFEHLRQACDLYSDQCGVRPSVYLAALGPLAKRLPRVNFCKDLFIAGGFRVLGGDGDGDPIQLASAFAASGAPIAVICGSDDAYATTIPLLAPALHRAGARRVVLAGNPGANETAYRDAGVDRFAFVKCDVVSLLTDLLAEEGVYA